MSAVPALGCQRSGVTAIALITGDGGARVCAERLRDVPLQVPGDLVAEGLAQRLLPSDDGNRARRTRCVSKAGVSGDELAAKCFGQRDVGGVIGRHVVAQLPYPSQETNDGEPAQPEPRPASQCGAGVVGADVAAQHLGAKGVGGLPSLRGAVRPRFGLRAIASRPRRS